MPTRRALITAAALLPSLRAPADARTILAATPISRMDLPWWKRRFEEKQAELRARPPRLVFYGDSITQNWERSGPPEWQNFAPIWRAFYGDRDALNLGFTGDTTASLLWRVEHGEAEGIAPKAAVILIGANNLGRLHWSAEDTLAGIDAIISELRRRLPRTQLVLLSVLPSGRGAWAEATRAAINAGLAARYREGVPGVTYLDVTGIFLRDGRIDTGAYLDPRLTPPEPALHPDARAAARMAAAI